MRIQKSLFKNESAKLRALHALVSHVPRALRALAPHVPRALRAVVPYVLSCLTCFVLYMPSNLTCLMPCVLSCLTCLTCLVPYVLSCLTCSRTSRALVPYMPLVPHTLRPSYVNTTFSGLFSMLHVTFSCSFPTR